MEMDGDLGLGAAAEITRDWVQELGTEDGAALAARVIDDLGGAETREEIEAVSQDTVATVRALADTYRERGVSDPLIVAWRAACQSEMERVFREARDELKAEIPAPPLAAEGEAPVEPPVASPLPVLSMNERASTPD